MAFRIIKDTRCVEVTNVNGERGCVCFQGSFIKPGEWIGDTEIKEIEIGEGVREIGVNAFANCTSLTKVILPASVKIIRRGAFAGCTSLETVVTPDTLKKIECTITPVAKLSPISLTPDILTRGYEMSLLYEGDYDPHYWD